MQEEFNRELVNTIERMGRAIVKLMFIQFIIIICLVAEYIAKAI